MYAVLKYLVIAFIYICSLHASEFEEFYILPMGQGNGQLVIYQNGSEKVGVLYDLGSKSLQMHPKFSSRGDWDQKFIAKSEIRKAPTEEKRRRRINVDNFSSPQTKKSGDVDIRARMPLSTNAKVSASQRDSIETELQLFVRDRLKDLTHLFIFLSHSDEDHINFIARNIIPDEVPITIFLAGDWFGNIGCKKDETNVTRSIVNVLTFLKERVRINPEGIVFNFPYYNDFNIPGETGGHVDFNQFIRQSLSINEDMAALARVFSAYCLRTNLNTPNPKFFTGSLIELYNTAFRNEESHIRASSEDISKLSHFTNSVAGYIHVWSLNHQTDNINGHSMVLSCRLPSLDMSVVLTGDAQHSVFQRIVSEYRDSGGSFRRFLELNDEHLVTFILPHHGSEENSSGSALSFFTPNVFGVPAGDGAQYGHPSLSLINSINELYIRERIPLNFNATYERQKGLDFVAIEEKKHVRLQTTDFAVPFLCPNLYGCIKWDRSGIYTNFDNIIDVEGDLYTILYDSHIWEADKNVLREMVRKRDVAVVSAKDTTQTSKMRVQVPSSEISGKNYSCILKSKNGSDTYAGVIVDKKLYFYKIIRAKREF